MNDWDDFNTGIIDEFRANAGKVGGGFEGAPMILVHHRGAKTGTERIAPLVYLPDGDAFVIFGSKGGAPSHPHWYLNLVANPETTVEVGTETIAVRARVATGDERTRLFTTQKEQMPPFAEYETKTAGIREIPVVVLDPILIDLTGHVALITGGNSGIGLGMALGLAGAGADVAIWGTNPEKNERAAATLVSAAPTARVHTERCDVADEAAQEAAFARTVEALGKVDSVFANAGVSGGVPSITDMTLAEWRRVMAVNLDGAFLTLRTGARHLVERGEGGSLVAVSSTSAVHGAPFQPHYGASKTALLGLVRATAVGLARHRIRVNALLPGWTDTDLTAPGKANQKFVDATVGRTPVRRWADPSEFGAVAVYLADPSLTFHTGDCLTVDGGYTIY